MVSQHVSSPRGSCQLQMSIPLADPSPSPKTMHPHGTGGLSPRTKELGGFCGEQATKHSCHNGENGQQVQLVHTLNWALHEPTVLGDKAGAPH